VLDAAKKAAAAGQLLSAKELQAVAQEALRPKPQQQVRGCAPHPVAGWLMGWAFWADLAFSAALA
jgi:hypothetical protein